MQWLLGNIWKEEARIGGRRGERGERGGATYNVLSV